MAASLPTGSEPAESQACIQFVVCKTKHEVPPLAEGKQRIQRIAPMRDNYPFLRLKLYYDIFQQIYLGCVFCGDMCPALLCGGVVDSVNLENSTQIYFGKSGCPGF